MHHSPSHRLIQQQTQSATHSLHTPQTQLHKEPQCFRCSGHLQTQTEFTRLIQHVLSLTLPYLLLIRQTQQDVCYNLQSSKSSFIVLLFFFPFILSISISISIYLYPSSTGLSFLHSAAVATTSLSDPSTTQPSPHLPPSSRVLPSPHPPQQMEPVVRAIASPPGHSSLITAGTDKVIRHWTWDREGTSFTCTRITHRLPDLALANNSDSLVTHIAEGFLFSFFFFAFLIFLFLH